jgi:predicted RNase H-like nuclease
VLTIIALGWTLPDSRPAGRLPKYNPVRRKTFSSFAWQYVCGSTSDAFRERRLMRIVQWIDAAPKISPRKYDQDMIDACLCLLVAVHLAERKPCIMVGTQQTGYIVVPPDVRLQAELDARCEGTGRASSEWVRKFRLAKSADSN